MPTRRQLELFLVAARLGSVSRAAEYLGISQPGVSKQIRALEAQLGKPLFARRRGAASQLTDFGRETVARAQELVDLQKQFERSSKSTGKRISPIIYVRPFLLGRVTDLLASRFPADGDLHPVFRVNDDTFDVMSETCLREGDCMLAHMTEVPDDSRLMARVLRMEPCGLYVSGGADAAADWQPPPDLNQVHWLLPTGSPRLNRWCRQWIESAGIDSRNCVDGPQFIESTMIQIMREGGGSAFMDRHAQSYVDDGLMVRIDVPMAPVFLVLMARKDFSREVFFQLVDALAVV